MRPRPRAVVVLSLTTVLAAAVGPADARVSRDFYGVVSQGQLAEGDFDAMRSGGVGTLRFAINWRQVEPRPGEYDWSQVDSIVTGATASGIKLMPFTSGTPSWLGDPRPNPQLDSARARDAWTALHTELVRRYGRAGTLPSAEGARPIVQWQPGNEPNLRYYWGRKPQPRRYARMLKLAARAIHGEDGRARIVLAGLAPGRGALPWAYLRKLYRVAGIKRHFDAVAFHPYARTIREVRYLLDRMRAEIRRTRDGGTPLEVTELSWGSGGPRGYPLVRSPKGQARMLRKSFRALRKGRRAWRISGVQWFSWDDGVSADPACLWCEHAGLFTLDRRPKPAWKAFKRFTDQRGGRR